MKRFNPIFAGKVDGGFESSSFGESKSGFGGRGRGGFSNSRGISSQSGSGGRFASKFRENSTNVLEK